MTIPSWTDYNNGVKFTNEKEATMPLPYDPETLGEIKQKTFEPDQPGNYWFEVKDAQNKEGAKGTYTTLTLSVDTGKRTAKVYTNVFYSEASLWKLKQFIDCVDMPAPREPEDFIGASGKAGFEISEKGYLEPKFYIPKGSAEEDDVAVASVKKAFASESTVEEF